MQNKKSLLQRLLVIYITFFIVLVASVANSILPNVSQGLDEGRRIGADLSEKWQSGSPRMFYILPEIRVFSRTEPTAVHPATPGAAVKLSVSQVDLTVEQAPGDNSVLGLAFRALGGSPWIYVLTMLCPLFFVAIIVLMFIIIHSLRRSIREECPLDKRNVWYLRTIGTLTIGIELISAMSGWMMSCRAAELLSQSDYIVDTHFAPAYSPIIMGILILFAAEVFAIGQNLSEEQKLTI